MFEREFALQSRVLEKFKGNKGTVETLMSNESESQKKRFLELKKRKSLTSKNKPAKKYIKREKNIIEATSINQQLL